MLRYFATLPWRARPWAAPYATRKGAAISAAGRYAGRLALVATTLAVFGLSLRLLDRFPLREDEAIYGYWALHALHVDPNFLQVWPDKPPLFLWLLAALFALAGPDPAVARWLNIAATTLTVPLAALGAQRLWRAQPAGLFAALALALNPFALSFAPTVYTDPMLTFWGTLAVVLALPGRQGARPGWAGAALGAAMMTKQQGALYLPLVMALVALLPGQTHTRRWGRFLVGLAAVTLPVIFWDSRRWAVAPSPWDRALQTYAPLALAPLSSWSERLGEWAALGWYLAASDALWLSAGLLLLVAALARPPEMSRSGWPRSGVAAALVLGWGVAYWTLHVVTTVQVWDRYLLPLAPLWAWVLAWPATRLDPSSFHPALQAAPSLPWQSWRARLVQTLPWLILLVALGLLPPALSAASGGLPIGGDHGDYSGLPEALAWVAAQPQPQILYHRTVGWHARFYLFGAVESGVTELRWFPSAVYLADNAAKSPYPRRYLVLPDWAPLPDLPLHLATRGLTLHTRLRSGRFTVYEITHRPQAACAWCWCGPRLALAVAAAPTEQMSRP